MTDVKSSSGTRKCYHCGKPGHQAKECAQAPKPADGAPKKATPPPAAAAPVAAPPAAAAPAAPSASSGTRKCYNCGLTGHPAKECPSAPKDGGKSSAGGAGKKSAGGASADDKSFKERLEEYKKKTEGQENVKKNFCYLWYVPPRIDARGCGHRSSARFDPRKIREPRTGRTDKARTQAGLL